MSDRIIISYLKKSPPEKWHQLAMEWNWDYSKKPMYWIIKNPLCDKATALLIYWRQAPRYLAKYADRSEVPGYEIEDYGFVKDIEKRYASGFYTSEEFYFDPSPHLNDYVEEEMKHPIPEVMYKPVQGKEVVSPKYVLSLPQEVWDEIEKSER